MQIWYLMIDTICNIINNYLVFVSFFLKNFTSFLSTVLDCTSLYGYINKNNFYISVLYVSIPSWDPLDSTEMDEEIKAAVLLM